MAFASLAEQKSIKLNFEACESLPEIYFDSDKLEKIFFNLLSNAFKFTPEGGQITVSIAQVEINSELIQITVKDTGIGIPAEQLPHVFDRFFQVYDGSKREHGGTGIGLALTKELVELHQGKIEVKSEVGKGAEFIVYLPAGKAHLSEAEIVSERHRQ